jgi:hypothetical protein
MDQWLGVPRRYRRTMTNEVAPLISDAEHWATYPDQPRPVQIRMDAAERLRHLDKAAKAAQANEPR